MNPKTTQAAATSRGNQAKRPIDKILGESGQAPNRQDLGGIRPSAQSTRTACRSLPERYTSLVDAGNARHSSVFVRSRAHCSYGADN
ncbi:MAG: hypothetical protein RBU37_15510 [Myxococcota bacterium]|nr:hypothetical protein [Myxococcota bacterium]